MSSFLRLLSLTLILWGFFAMSLSVQAQPLIPFDTEGYPGVKFDVVEGEGSEGVVATVRELYKTVKQILGPILVVLIAYFAIRLVIAGGNEDKFSEASRHFLYLLVGTAFVVFADFLSQTFFLYKEGTSFVSDQGAIGLATGKFQEQIQLFIKFLRYVLGGLAVFYVVKSGSMILFSADEEVVNKQKDVFMYGGVGFLLIIISEALVNVVFDIQTLPGIEGIAFGQDVFTQQSVNVEGGLSLLSNITNLLLATLSGIFLFMLIGGGVMYAASGGNEESSATATKIITSAVLGLIIAFSSYTIVAEFSAGGRELKEANPVTTPLSK